MDAVKQPRGLIRYASEQSIAEGTKKLNTRTTERKIEVMQYLGVPYPEGYAETANDDLKIQAEQIANGLKAQNIDADPETEIIALIAYLQRLGTDIYK